MIARLVDSFHPMIALNLSQQLSNEHEARFASLSDGSVNTDSEAGASGPESGSISLSRDGMIAICVVGACICVFGAISAILFYHVQKKDWQIRENLRKSAKRVNMILTPRRSEFPRNLKRMRTSWGLTKIEELPTSSTISQNLDSKRDRSNIRKFVMPHPNRMSIWPKNNDKIYNSV